MKSLRFATISLAVFLSFFADIATGLQFSLTHRNSSSAGLRPACVLLCKQTRLGSSEDDSHRIKNLTIFKTVTTGQDNSGSTKPLHLTQLAYVSPTQPNLDQVSDGMKLRGAFKDGVASLTIEVFKQTDCSLEFTCEIMEINSVGKETVTSHRLVQTLAQSNIGVNLDSPNLTASMLMRLFTLVEEQSLKLASIAKTTERLDNENQIVKLKSELQNAQLHTRIRDIEEKINNQHDKLLMVAKASEKIEDKICQLDTKLSVIDSEAIQDKVLKSIESRIDKHFTIVLDATQKTDEVLNKTASFLKSLRTENSNFQKGILKSYNNLFDNVTRDMTEIFVHDKNLTETLQENFELLRDDVGYRWLSLHRRANESTIEALNALQIARFNLNSTLESTLRDFFGKTSYCKKNQDFVFAPLINPGEYKMYTSHVDIPILCDTVTSGGGWIVIQRRSTGAVEFYRSWNEYKQGFGTLDTEFWLGNDNIHAITSSGRFELRIDMKYEGQSYYAHYNKFAIAGEENQYTLTVEGYSGTAGDSLKNHNGSKFTTHDRDHDKSSGNCAVSYTGAWWYYNCYDSSLNGKWGGAVTKSLSWNTLTNAKSVSFSEIKIREVW